LATAKKGQRNQQSALVGLSGGVDSAVAAWLLLEQGFRVTGVTFDLWRAAEPGSTESMRSRDVILRAKAVADRLGIEHVVVNASDAFQKFVIDYFVDEYSRGRTPNPCVKCNSRLRFTLFSRIAREMGVDRIATGHYARLTGEPPRLSRAADRGKDQSYVLAEVSPTLLCHVLFPLGELTKQAVRGMSQEIGLGEVVSEESQETCFIPDDDYRAFLRSKLGARPGQIVDVAGESLGVHSGTYNYTVGQRKGLGHAAGRPLYVVSVDSERDVVVAGPEPAGSVGSVLISNPVIHRPAVDTSTTVQLRSAGHPIPARAVGHDIVLLQEPATGVAPGQTAVLYGHDDVLLAGTIAGTRPWSASDDSSGAARTE
jgi:tRNA-specific 2-thiouridylase